MPPSMRGDPLPGVEQAFCMLAYHVGRKHLGPLNLPIRLPSIMFVCSEGSLQSVGYEFAVAHTDIHRIPNSDDSRRITNRRPISELPRRSKIPKNLYKVTFIKLEVQEMW